jgi:hypothetical protein
LNELACRGCRKALLAPAGCALCDPIRKHLIVLNESEEERPSLATVSAEAVNALRAQLRAYKDQLAVKDLKPADVASIHDKQRAVAGALSKLLDAARKIQGDGLAAVERMSFKERAELFVEWFMTLPAAYRAQLKEQIEAHETAWQQVAGPDAGAAPTIPALPVVTEH